MLYFSHFLITFPHVLVILKMMHQKIQNRIKKTELFLAFFFICKNLQQYISTFILKASFTSG
jgi:hypothetical protein